MGLHAASDFPFWLGGGGGARGPRVCGGIGF